MNDDLSKIALMSVFYEEKKSFFEVYLPFIIQICRQKEINKLSEIESQIEKIFGFKLLINTIKAILTENEYKYFQLKKPARSDWEIVLNEDGKRIADELIIKEEEVKKDINYLEEDAFEYISKILKFECDKENVHGYIKSFLIKNSGRYFCRKELGDNGKCTDFEINFIIYLNNVVKYDARKDMIVERMWKGAILVSQLSVHQKDKNAPVLITELDILYR